MPANKGDDDQQYHVDEELANGPMENRGCTDILCCLLFLAFLGGMVGIAGYSISRGNPNLIGRGYDTDGKICGISAGYEDYPYLYFTIPTKKYVKQTLCLSSCPGATPPSVLSCKYNTLYPAGQTPDTCAGLNDKNAIATEYALNKDETGKVWIYETAAYFGRFCIPTSGLSWAQDAATDALNSDLLDQWFSDVKTAWPVIAVAAAAAFIIGLMYMILLRCCAGVLTWVAIIGFIAGLGILGWRFYQNSKDLEAAAANTEATNDANKSNNNYKSQRIIAYICWGVAGFAALSVLCLYNRIRLAIAIIKAASDYVRNTLSVFLVPPIIIVILVAYYIYWVITSLYLVSSGEAITTGSTPISSFSFDSHLKKLMIYQLLGLLWVNAFILAATQFIIASSACLWYFSQGTGQLITASVSTSVYRLFRYHFGSIAFGSLILALVQLVRIILAYFQAQAQKMQGKDSKIIKFVFNCLQCYLACFERFIKFLNRNAYIQIALTGKNFCMAAKDGFMLIAKNPLRVGALASIGGLFILFGKIFIAAITALGAFLFVTKSSTYENKLYNPFIPVLLVFIFSYCIAAVFMTIYGLAADAILACFIVDEAIHAKKNAPPLHCPESLKDFIDTHKK